MDLSMSLVLICTIFVELFLLNASASEDNIPLYFADEQTDIVLPLLSSTALQCTVVSSGADQINITWRKDGSIIANTTSRWILPDGTLRVEDIEPHAGEGSYDCLARHSIGTIASRRIRLEAPTIPEFVQHPQDLVAFQGESVRLECIANGNPKADITWVKDGQPLNISRTRVNTFSGVLQITEATPQDAGTYECLATNAAGQRRRSLAANVTIRSSNANEHLRPRLLAGPLDQTAVVFDTVTVVFECFLSGRPRPAVSWMQQGGAVFSSVGRVRVTRYGNLEISDVQLSDAGTYICSWTEMSETKAYRHARLSVLAHPQLVLDIATMKPHTLKHRRQLVRLKCEFDGVPVPRLVWLKNGQVLEPNGRIRLDNWELIITSGETSDSGFYQCRGENSVGAFQSTTWVEIEANENAPLPPVDLVVIPQTSTGVKLSWMNHPLNQNRKIMAYSIHAFPTRGGLEIQYVQKVEEGTEFVWEVFQPFTNYTFYIVAYNNDGGSDHSTYVTAMTAEDVPLESPLMEVTPVGPTGLRLRWSELGPDLARGVITQYKVVHRHRGNSSYQQNLVNADIREFVIQGLHSEMEYEVIALAGTVKGFPLLDSASWVTVTTEAAKNTRVPTRPGMNISLVSSNSIMVSWMMDNSSQVIESRLKYRRINQKHQMIPADDVTTVINLDKAATKYIVAELESYAVYQVTLASLNEFGWSDSVTKTFRTDAGINGDAKISQVDGSENDLPSAPTKIDVESLNSSTIVARWGRPADVIDITRYTVRYRPDPKESGSDVSGVKFVTSPLEMVVIGDLSAHTLYDLSVQTHTNNAIGPFSSIVKCRTEEGIPSEPKNVQLTLYSDTTVRVTWNPPVHSNGVIIRYIIFYSTDDESASSSEWLTKTSSGSSLSSLVANLKPSTIYYFRLQAATFTDEGPLSDTVHIRTHDPSDLLYNDVANLATSSMLSDQDLGIIIGSAIGITCIVLCVIFIVIRDRRSARHAAAATRSHVANGVVKSCRCHLTNGSAVAETWRRVGSDDDDDFPSVNSVLVENENCDTKGGYTQSERQVRIPPVQTMCNGVQHCDRLPNQPPVNVSLSTGNEKATSLDAAVCDAGDRVDKLPSEQLSSSDSSEQNASCSATDSDIINVEPVDASSTEACGASRENNEADEDVPVGHFSQGDAATESDSLMDNGGRTTSHCCDKMPVGIAGECASCIGEDGSRKTTEEEKEEKEEFLG